MVWRANDEHELTSHDAMTGLLNRQGFEARWAAIRSVASSEAAGRQRVVMVDLDGFKAVNDTLGHAAGDEVPQPGRPAGCANAVRYTDARGPAAAATSSPCCLRASRIRLAAERVALRMHARLCEPLVIAGREVAIGASLGVMVLDRDTAPDALDTADRAMFDAKEGGGGVRSAALA